MLSHRSNMIGMVAAVQNPPMDTRMQRLHAAIEHLGKARQLGDIAHRKARVAQRLGRSTGRHQFHAKTGQYSCKLHYPCLVGHGQQGTSNSL